MVVCQNPRKSLIAVRKILSQLFSPAQQLLLAALIVSSMTQATSKPNLYLIPGMATDCRVFKGFDLQNYTVHCIEWASYSDLESLGSYAERLLEQVDTTQPFALAGVSMGGMLALEMAKLHQPEFVALISSAESARELPKFYKMARFLPFHKLNTSFLLKLYLATPVAMRGVKESADRQLYIQMIRDTGVEFMNWQIDNIIGWKGSSQGVTCPIFRIHGAADTVIPLSENTVYDQVAEGRTHKMVINHPEIVSRWLDGLVNR